MYEIEHTRDHEFVKHGRKRVKREKCVQCDHVYSNIVHHGYPQSLNVGGSGFNIHVFQGMKQAWQRRFFTLMTEAEVPSPLSRVTAEGMIVFPDRIGRDQGNFKFLIEKALGDALQEGGWLVDDEFYPEPHYEFGGLVGKYVKDVAQTRIMLFTTDPIVEDVTLYGRKCGNCGAVITPEHGDPPPTRCPLCGE